MTFQSDSAEVYVPDGAMQDAALVRTTHLGIGAHQDDLEIMAIEPILACYDREDMWFAGLIVNDGATAPRAGTFKDFSDAEMARARADEQKRAADLGKYGAQVLLGYPNGPVKDPNDARPTSDIESMLLTTSPAVVYTHNLMDKHDAHVAVALRTIAAIRRLSKEERPPKLYGCEVWRDLDWVPDSEKVIFDCSAKEDLQRQLLEVFESQVAGGKRYDHAALGRRRANATYQEPNRVDEATGVVLGVDMTPLIEDDSVEPLAFAIRHVEGLAGDIKERIERLG